MGIPLISFFTGGGFLDLGFEQAGFDVRWTNEYNTVFASIYAHGMTAWTQALNPAAPAASISSTASITELDAGKILSETFPKKRPEIFGVIGGPPCTDFSVGGRNAGHSGDAGRMTSVYVDMIRKLAPTFFLLENVPNLGSHPKHSVKFENLIKKLERAGYCMLKDTLNALEYGAPQDRRRLIVIGFCRSQLKKWFPCASQPMRMLELHFQWPAKTHPDAKTCYIWPTTIKFGSTPIQPVGVPRELCVWQAVCRYPAPETLPNGKEHFAPYSTKFESIPEGDVVGKSFKRLHRYRYSPTAWYGNNEVHLHPFKPRRLSVREALRIQTVPDTYIMPEDIPLSAKYKVIGNGVPCVLAKAVAESIKNFIATRESRK